MTKSGKLTGLTDQQVLASRVAHGRNDMDLERPHRLWEVVKEIATEPLFVILVCTASLYFILGEYGEGVIMLVALAFVSGISLYQENRSRTAVEALKKLSAPNAVVIRNGQSVEIKTAEIVIDDLILLEDGNLIPADAVLIELHDFSVNESILTGESLPVLKEMNSKIFQGTLVMTGSCLARVVAIGKQTEFGKISQSLQDLEPEKTPLQRQINAFVKKMVAAGIVAFLVVCGINFFISRDILHSLLRGLTLAMSVLPEEIPVAFSTFMALGAYHLYKKRVIARTPHTVETLGAATVICVDKTGTITENRMSLSAVYDFKLNKVFDFTVEPESFSEVLEHAMWASETKPFDAMEKSIHLSYGQLAPTDFRPAYSFTHEYPLSGKPPIMTHVFTSPTGERVIACKGGVEGILSQTKLTAEKITRVKQIVQQLATRGFRVLAVARSLHQGPLPNTQHEFEFDLLGLIGFYDPPKQNISNILKRFYAAGIQVKMITGDYVETARSIAQQIDMKNNAEAITGDQVIQMSVQELQEKVVTTSIFARMFPEAKLKVIEALKANGEVVAMTGDGVNDGPALKAAHIGIAMGQRGSEVAKQAASLVLVDDDLEHMTEAVALGRRIYENLKKAIQYIISIHIPIILIVTVPLLFMWKYVDIFSPVHVIFLELIMGPTCSVIFEREPIEADSMHRPPRKMSSDFFSWSELSMSIIQGLMITLACLTLGYYFMESGKSEVFVRTVIYSTLIFSNLFLTLVNRSFHYSIFTTLQYKNALIPFVLLISLTILFLSIYVESVQRVFNFGEIPLSTIGLCFAAAFAGVIWVEIHKWLKRRTLENNKVS